MQSPGNDLNEILRCFSFQWRAFTEKVISIHFSQVAAYFANFVQYSLLNWLERVKSMIVILAGRRLGWKWILKMQLSFTIQQSRWSKHSTHFPWKYWHYGEYSYVMSEFVLFTTSKEAINQHYLSKAILSTNRCQWIDFSHGLFKYCHLSLVICNKIYMEGPNRRQSMTPNHLFRCCLGKMLMSSIHHDWILSPAWSRFPYIPWLHVANVSLPIY